MWYGISSYIKVRCIATLVPRSEKVKMEVYYFKDPTVYMTWFNTI